MESIMSQRSEFIKELTRQLNLDSVLLMEFTFSVGVGKPVILETTGYVEDPLLRLDGYSEALSDYAAVHHKLPPPHEVVHRKFRLVFEEVIEERVFQ